MFCLSQGKNYNQHPKVASFPDACTSTYTFTYSCMGVDVTPVWGASAAVLDPVLGRVAVGLGHRWGSHILGQGAISTLLQESFWKQDTTAHKEFSYQENGDGVWAEVLFTEWSVRCGHRRGCE